MGSPRPADSLSSAAYCSPAHIKAWNCGTACNANPAPTKVYTTGGDNQANPYYYVIANSTTLIFAVAGTNPLSALSIGDDLDFGLTTPDTAYFPSNGGAQLHHGFYSAFTRLAADLTTAVQSGIDDGYTNVLVTGHSLGGAIGHQVAVYLQQKFPSLTVTARLFASPRVGNAAWANYVDSTVRCLRETHECETDSSPARLARPAPHQRQRHCPAGSGPELGLPAEQQRALDPYVRQLVHRVVLGPGELGVPGQPRSRG